MGISRLKKIIFKPSAAPQSSSWAQLPKDLLGEVYARLDTLSVIRSCGVCRPWRAAGQQPDLWRKRFGESPLTGEPSSIALWQRLCLEQERVLGEACWDGVAFGPSLLAWIDQRRFPSGEPTRAMMLWHAAPLCVKTSPQAQLLAGDLAYQICPFETRVLVAMSWYQQACREPDQLRGALLRSWYYANPRLDGTFAIITRVLVERGVDVNFSTSGGTTPLMVAAQRGFYEAASILLQYGAKVNAHDTIGKTALHHAVREGNVPMVRLLLNYAAEAHKPDHQGMSPLQCVRLADEEILPLAAPWLWLKDRITRKRRVWEKTRSGIFRQSKSMSEIVSTLNYGPSGRRD